MTASLSDALVFFGATGDLAYKQIFPALQAMIKRSHLDLPIIGVARSGRSLDEFRNSVRDRQDFEDLKIKGKPKTRAELKAETTKPLAAE